MNLARRTRRAVISLGAAFALGATAGCARAAFVPPAGPGVPIPDAAAAWEQASAGCGDVRAVIAGARASGKVGSQRVWPVSLEIAVTNTDSIYVGATAAGNSVFVLAGTGGRASLWLRPDQRVVTATPAAILEAVVGVALSPGQLLGMLSGCVARTADAATAVRHGNLIELPAPEGRLFLSQFAGQWQVKALVAGTFVVELSRRTGRQPEDVWIRSAGAASVNAALHLTISDPQINGPIPAAVFDLPAGAGAATPMSLEELRASGPWKDR
ncbi:MAG TPA: hypothetical protein VFV78_06720 [Vicinamibacterales bacterium]|nr:hypothetical protein [Vicinamibacterales bacterium]